MGRMLGLILALLLTIAAPSAGAVVLLEGPEPNDCPCEATPGGTILTTQISGFLSENDLDMYRFDFDQPLASFIVTPTSPSIAGDGGFNIIDLVLFDETGSEVDVCFDCYFGGGQVQAYDLPAGTYYVMLADDGGGGLAGPSLAGPSLAGPGQARNNLEPPGLGEYTLSVAAVASTATPEPGSLALLAGATALFAARRSRGGIRH